MNETSVTPKNLFLPSTTKFDLSIDYVWIECRFYYSTQFWSFRTLLADKRTMQLRVQMVFKHIKYPQRRIVSLGADQSSSTTSSGSHQHVAK
jgi:hypothetical protein